MFKKKPSRVIGIDNSTNSTAYAIIEDGKLMDYGEIWYKGSTAYDRLLDTRKKMNEFIKDLDIDYLVIEETINVRSVKVAIKMAQSSGIVVSSIMEKAKVSAITPLVWQRAIGNNTLTAAEKAKIKKENPGKSPTWYTNANRKFRKQRTMDWVENKFGIKCETDNISDAVAIAFVGYTKLCK